MPISRDTRAMIEDLNRDLRYAVRTLARTPAFTVAAVLTLAIGIGGSTAVFSLIDAVLLRRLPFPDADRLVMLYEDNSKSGFPRDAVAPVTYDAWASSNDVFDAMAAVTEFGAVLQNNGEPYRINGRRVTRSLFDVLGARAAIGRTFLPGEDRPGGPSVVVLSFGLWQRRFGGDPSIVGRSILLNDAPFLVVGVMPKTFQFLENYVGLWVPAAFTTEELTNGAHYLTVVGRMKPGVDESRVRATLEPLGLRILQKLPASARREPPRPVVVTLKEEVAGSARAPLLLLFTAVGVVLLITCAACCWRARPRGGTRSRYGARSAPRAAAWCVS
jgi:putative ABC transport system permease protein